MTFNDTYHILVLEAGFVLIGCPRQSEDALFLTLDSVAVIRRWGTSRGLGQLAIEGPQAETKIDAEGDGVQVCKLKVSRIIPCSDAADKAWKRRLKS